MIVYTGDIHGDARPIAAYVEGVRSRHEVVPSTIVILGDVGANYYLHGRDRKTKHRLNRIGVDLLCIHGNHEARPQTIKGYEEELYLGGTVLVESQYPHLKFAPDGEVYDLEGRQTIVIGGAYSIDKSWRLANGLPWFANEQPSEEVKARVVTRLRALGWRIDQVLSHTCPLRFAPTDTFFPHVDQSGVDFSTELWLDEIEERTTYNRWLCGHYHIDRDLGTFHFLKDRFME